MFEVIMENIIKILTAVMLTLISVGGAYLTNLLATRTKLNNISNAIYEVQRMATMTVQELQQTVVENFKAANTDGKLTNEDIRILNNMLIKKTKEKLSAPIYELINAAGADLEAIILGAGEAWLSERVKAHFLPAFAATTEPVAVEVEKE